jgi:hypothetical protein
MLAEATTRQDGDLVPARAIKEEKAQNNAIHSHSTKTGDCVLHRDSEKAIESGSHVLSYHRILCSVGHAGAVSSLGWLPTESFG